MKLYIDLETYNPVDDLKTCGVYRYAEHAEILIVCYAIDKGRVRVWDYANEPAACENFFDLIERADQVVAHNSGFDRIILEHKRWIGKNDPRWRDTYIRALAHGLPGGLGMLCDIYRLSIDKAKDKAGRELIRLFCKPTREGQRETKFTHPSRWQEFLDYARLDVEAMRELDNKLPSWNDTEDERALWQYDRLINDRGFLVDVDLAQAAIKAVGSEKRGKDVKLFEQTGGAVGSAQQGAAIIEHIKDAYGIDIPDMQKSTIQRRLDDPELSEDVKDILRSRLLGSGTSVSKYKALVAAVCSDNRLRGTLQFCGSSRAGRWSGRIFQPQNLPRPTHKQHQIDAGIEALKMGHADLIFPDVAAIASSAIRSVIVAPSGKKLVVSDLSSIEGRVLAWLAGEQYKLHDYAEYDAGAGYDMYVQTYARTFNIKPKDVNKSQRQLGKVLELALGYQGGVSAFVTFSQNFNLSLEKLSGEVYHTLPVFYRDAAGQYYDALCAQRKKPAGLSREAFVTCDAIKRMWRAANIYTERFWGACEKAAIDVIAEEAPYREVRKVRFLKSGRWLLIRLPSGRHLCYAAAHIKNGSVVYRGVDQYTRKWSDIATYGGKITENITQAVARDILACGMIYAEDSGYSVVLSVHDELITETPDNPAYNAEALSDILSTRPAWASDLPLAAAGFEAYRYKKEQ